MSRLVLWVAVAVVGAGSALAQPTGPESAPSEAAARPRELAFGDSRSETLTAKAWEALARGDHQAVEAYTRRCLMRYEDEAREQSAALTTVAPPERVHDFWALNDVATCLFIRGRSLLAQGRQDEARQVFTRVVEDFPFAQCWDPTGWFWMVAEGAQDYLVTMGTPYDFGDYRSETLTVKAWKALDQRDHRGVELYTTKCVALYAAEAKRQQGRLTAFAPADKVFTSWALNDVATCWFILGESLREQGRDPEARAAFERIVADFGFAQCWDPKGWFWKVAEGARLRIEMLEPTPASGPRSVEE